MGQVRKLLFENEVPKAQEGYKFNLDGQDIYYSDQDIKEIGDRIAALPVEYRRFFGNAVNAIKSGNQSGNRASNTVSMPQLGGMSERELKKLSKQNPSYWSSLVKDNTYYAKEAINEYLKILHSVANKPKKAEETPSKTEVKKSDITLDWNINGKEKYLSPTHENNLSAAKRVSDLLQHLKDGENSQYNYTGYNTDAINAWLNGLEGDDKYSAGNTFFDNLWTSMKGKGYKYDPETEDLLSMFGITYGLTAPTKSTAPNTGNISVKDNSGIVNPTNDGVVTKPGENTNVNIFTTPDGKQWKLDENGQLVPVIVKEEGSIPAEQPEENFEELVVRIPTFFNPDRTAKISGVRIGGFRVGDGVGNIFDENGNLITDNSIGPEALFTPTDETNPHYIMYKLPNGEYMLLSQNGIGHRITPEFADQLSNGKVAYKDITKNLQPLVYKANTKKEEGGKIDFKKVDSLVAKNSNKIAKGENGLDLKDLPDVGGGYNYNIPSALKFVSPLISTGRFIETSIAQRKDRDLAKKMLNEGRFNDLAVWANAPSTAMPVLDRQLKQIQLDRMSGIKPVTNDFITNFGAANQRENQLYDRENSVFTQMSNQYKTIQDQITDVMNKNLANAITTRNQNVARQKAIDAAIIGADREYNQRRDASHQAASLEVQNNIRNDIDYLNRLNEFNYRTKQQDIFDKQIDDLFSGARGEWNALSANDQANYGDFETYLQRSDKWKDVYATNKAQIDLWNRQKDQRLLDWNVQNKLNYGYPSILMGSTSTVGMKKGGRVNGKTRYTLEPDERLWIDNNKAAHNAVAKLDDHIIKLLLKALK